MNPQNNQGSGSSTPLDPPLKRKRGRPRKDESQPQVEAMSSSLPGGSDHLRRNNPPFGPTVPSGSSQVVNQAPAGSNMIGQPVSGIIDGKFDVGYLLRVKIGDSDTYMRGVAFIPDRVVPVTASNDLAPQARMYTRAEVQVPLPPPAQPQLPGSIPSSSELSGKQSAHPSNTAAQQFASVTLPLTDKFPAATSMGLAPGGKTLPQQVLTSGAASIPVQSASVPLARQDELLLEFDASTRKVADEKRPDAPSAAATTFGVLPASGTVNLELQIQHQADGLKTGQSASASAPAPALDGGNIMGLELLQPPPVISEPGTGAISSQSMGICLGNPTTSPGKAAPPPPEPSSASAKVTISDPPSLHLNGGNLVGNAVGISEADAMAKPDSDASSAALQKILESQFGCSSGTPMELFEKETPPPPPPPAAPPAAAAGAADDPMLGNDGNVLPRVTEPQFCNASSASADCTVKDAAAIPPAES